MPPYHARLESAVGSACKAVWRARKEAESVSGAPGVEEDLRQIHVELCRVLEDLLSGKPPRQIRGQLRIP